MTNSLDRLRRDAKALKKSHEAGDTHGLARVAAHPPRPGGGDLKHADFLHVIARENGFASWPRAMRARAARSCTWPFRGAFMPSPSVPPI